jgi:uncharacterized protein (DUF58 family)
MLLDARARELLQRMALRSRTRVRASRVGRHRSHGRGESLDFADYRPYSFGDDYRRIDHNLRARLGVTLVRLYEAEEELPIRLIVDASASMGFHGKLRCAQEAAAVVTYLGLVGGDRVMPFVVPGAARAPYLAGPSGRHPAAWPQMEAWLESLHAEGAADLGASVGGVVGGQAIRGIVVLISDLLDPGWERLVDTCGVAGGGLVLQVIGRDELDPDIVGDLRLIDAETGAVVDASATAPVLGRHGARVRSFIDDAAARARRAGMDHFLLVAGEATVDSMVRSLQAAGSAR